MIRFLKYLIIWLIAFPVLAHSEIIFEDNFNSQTDWTVTQPSGSTEACYNFYGTDCGLYPSGWSGFYNGACLCGSEIADEPGNNLYYINASPGYPTVTTNTSRGGSGKSMTFWQESCTSIYDNSDGQIGILFDEQPETYLRMFFRAQPGYEYITTTNMSQKLGHMQHYVDGSPTQYFNVNPGNQPVSTFQLLISNEQQLVKIGAEARCRDSYYCHSQILWPVSSITTAYQPGGLLDGDWHCIEWRFKINSAVGVADGIMECWLDGTKLAYSPDQRGDNIEWNDLDDGDLRGFRYATIGGNSNNQWDTSCSDMADCEQWYAIDDVVISTEYIGPDYVIGGDTYTDPTVTITDPSNGFSTTASTVTVTGTATKDDALTITGVSVNGTAATSSDGFATWSATDVPVSVGSVTLTATVTDSEGQTAQDSVIGTRTEIPASTGATVKGCAASGGFSG